MFEWISEPEGNDDDAACGDASSCKGDSSHKELDDDDLALMRWEDDGGAVAMDGGDGK